MSCYASQVAKPVCLAALFVLGLCSRTLAGDLPAGSQSLAGFISDQFGVDALVPPLPFDQEPGKDVRPGTIVFGAGRRGKGTETQAKSPRHWDLTAWQHCSPGADRAEDKALMYSLAGPITFGPDVVSALFGIDSSPASGVLAVAVQFTDLFSLREPSDLLKESRKRAEVNCSAFEQNRSSSFLIKGVIGGALTLAIVVRDRQAGLKLNQDILSSKNSTAYKISFKADENTLLVSSKSPMLLGAVLSKWTANGR